MSDIPGLTSVATQMAVMLRSESSATETHKQCLLAADLLERMAKRLEDEHEMHMTMGSEVGASYKEIGRLKEENQMFIELNESQAQQLIDLKIKKIYDYVYKQREAKDAGSN